MSPPHPEFPTDRARRKQRLAVALHSQGLHHEWHTQSLEQLQEVEADIWATARKLAPDAPQAAIETARQHLGYGDLANHLVHRAKLPPDPDFAPEPLRIRSRYLENRILDLARELEPSDPRLAIDHALALAREHIDNDLSLVDDPDPTLRTARESLPEASRRMQRFATYPRPTQEQRVHQVLSDLRRLDLAHLQFRRASEERHHLAFGGNVTELRAALERIGDPRELLEESVAQIYRDPEAAIAAMRGNTRQQGLQATIERFGENPALFGKLQGVHFPALGNSPARSRALRLAWYDHGFAKAALPRRENMENELEAALSLKDRQWEARQLTRAFPSRDELLTELGRHMEGLELHEVRPLLQPGQAKLVQDLRRDEQQFLEPLREASRRFKAFHTGPRTARAAAEAKKIAGLFHAAPEHILSRLNPPQMQAVLVAAAIARRVAKQVVKVASV